MVSFSMSHPSSISVLVYTQFGGVYVRKSGRYRMKMDLRLDLRRIIFFWWHELCIMALVVLYRFFEKFMTIRSFWSLYYALFAFLLKGWVCLFCRFTFFFLQPQRLTIKNEKRIDSIWIILYCVKVVYKL